MKSFLLVLLVVLVSWLTYTFAGSGLYADEIKSSDSAIVKIKVVDEANQTTPATVSVRSDDGLYATVLDTANSTDAYLVKVKAKTGYDVVATAPHKVASQHITPQSGQALQLTLTLIPR